MNIPSFSVIFLGIALFALACTGAGVDKAVGRAEEHPQIIVTLSPAGISIDNQVGRPLLNVRVSAGSAGAPAAFVAVIPTIEANTTQVVPLAQLKSDEGTAADAAGSLPERAAVTARDTLGNSYSVTAP